MKISDFGIYSRPVLFERECSEFPYSLSGSCFGIKYKHQYLIVTAKHVLDNFNEDDNISIPYVLGSDNFLPINNLNTIAYCTFMDDTDKFDIAILNIEDKLLNENFDPNSFFEIEECLADITSFDKCVIYGFPQEINGIDYDDKKIRVQRQMLEADNIKKSPYDYCFSFETKNESKKYLNGLSGSPIFGLKENGKGYDYCLIGMMIREKYFLSSNWILKILEEI